MYIINCKYANRNLHSIPVLPVIVQQLIRKLIINFCVINGYNPDLLEITWELPPEVSYCVAWASGGTEAARGAGGGAGPQPQDTKKVRSRCSVLPLRFSRTPLPIRGAIAHAARMHPLCPLRSPPPRPKLLSVSWSSSALSQAPYPPLVRQMKTVSLWYYYSKSNKNKL